MTEFLLGVDEQAIAAETLRLRRRRAVPTEATRPTQEGVESETGVKRPGTRRG
jgi:hypothetical protein